MNKKILAIIVAVILVILSVVLIAVNNEGTEPDRLAAPTDNKQVETNKGEATQNGASDIASTEVVATEPVQKETKPSDVQTNVQPESGETLPPEVDVSMGVVEGEGSADLDEEGENPTESVQPTTPAPQPTTPAPQPTTPPQSDSMDPRDPLSENFQFTTLTFEGYLAMTGEQQAAVVKKFASPEMFVNWYNLAAEEYKAAHPDVEIGENGMINGGNLGN